MAAEVVAAAAQVVYALSVYAGGSWADVPQLITRSDIGGSLLFWVGTLILPAVVAAILFFRRPVFGWIVFGIYEAWCLLIVSSLLLFRS